MKQGVRCCSWLDHVEAVMPLWAQDDANTGCVASRLGEEVAFVLFFSQLVLFMVGEKRGLIDHKCLRRDRERPGGTCSTKYKASESVRQVSSSPPSLSYSTQAISLLPRRRIQNQQQHALGVHCSSVSKTYTPHLVTAPRSPKWVSGSC